MFINNIHNNSLFFLLMTSERLGKRTEPLFLSLIINLFAIFCVDLDVIAFFHFYYYYYLLILLLVNFFSKYFSHYNNYY
jgi:hypothetical protein